MFLRRYAVSDRANVDSVPNTVPGAPSFPAGVYNDGLLTVLDPQRSLEYLVCWRWLVGTRCVALASTGLGDLFVLFLETGEVHFLDVQQGALEFVGDDLEWLFDDFLCQREIIAGVLRERLVKTVARRLRPLLYGEVYVLEPWLLLGGTDSPERYVIGGCVEYLALVGQTLDPTKPAS